MYRLAICDDDKNFLEIICDKVKKYCELYNIDIQIGGFTESDLLMDTIEKGSIFDAYILDVEMPDYSGLDIVETLNKYTSVIGIILLTSYDKYAVKACNMRVLRYVLKECVSEELSVALTELFQCLQKMNQDRVYLIKNNKRFLKIQQKEIVYIYKYQKNSILVLEDGREEKDRLSLRDLYQKLNNDEMVFADRGIIVNLSHLRGIEDNVVTMDNNCRFTIGAEHVSELKQLLSLYWGEII